MYAVAIGADPRDMELESRGHKFARYVDDFIVMVKSANAAKRVMVSLIRYCEGQLQLIVNRAKSRAKSRAAALKSCEFLRYRLNNRGKLAWTEKAHHRYKERVKEITSRNRGHKVQTVIDELSLYIRGLLQYYKLSSTFSEVRALAAWIRWRVRLYYLKQWNALPGGLLKTARRALAAWPMEATSRARAAIIYSPWELIPSGCIWHRGADQGVLADEPD